MKFQKEKQQFGSPLIKPYPAPDKLSISPQKSQQQEYSRKMLAYNQLVE
jgi:hypothetical protein